MNTAAPLGLYLHIPFCRQKCIYCDFYSLAGSEDRMESYTDALCAHLRAMAPLTRRHQVDTIYLGGGTPSYLGASRLVRLLDTIQCVYHVDPASEITLEANPDSAGDPALLRTLRTAGFNRISLGMQSADDRELREIGRIHTMAQLRRAVGAIREAGFENLSLDLIYGLPGQTLTRWQSNLLAAVELAPEHLSCYGLKVEEGTPLFARRNTVQLPDDDAQAEMYLSTVETLHQRGYHQYEISNFARSGRESHHNLKYWTLGEYLGFGPGAHSDFGGRRFAYARDLSAYLPAAQGQPLLPAEEEILSQDDRLEEWLMLGLRTTYGLDPAEFDRRFSLPFSPFLPFLATCRQAGYAVWEQGRWHLTPRGFLVSNQIIVSLLELLPKKSL